MEILLFFFFFVFNSPFLFQLFRSLNSMNNSSHQCVKSERRISICKLILDIFIFSEGTTPIVETICYQDRAHVCALNELTVNILKWVTVSTTEPYSHTNNKRKHGNIHSHRHTHCAGSNPYYMQPNGMNETNINLRVCCYAVYSSLNSTLLVAGRSSGIQEILLSLYTRMQCLCVCVCATLNISTCFFSISLCFPIEKKKKSLKRLGKNHNLFQKKNGEMCSHVWLHLR